MQAPSSATRLTSIAPELLWAVALMALGYAFVAVPTYLDLARQIWSTEEQSHGPVVLAVAFWLMWTRREAFAALDRRAAMAPGMGLLALGSMLYVLGRSQAVIQAEVLGLVILLAAAILLLRGWAGLRLLWFPLFFMLFTIPLPGVLVQAVTLPLKSAVSYVVEILLHWAGYPVARTGVILTVGHYQLLVADACAGLTSIFTLEAFGLLYMHVMGYTDKARNILLAILVVPCAFLANVIRVVILVLITFYFGDAAGQGFVHQFAGIVLFTVALILLIVADRLIGLVPRISAQRRLAPATPT